MIPHPKYQILTVFASVSHPLVCVANYPLLSAPYCLQYVKTQTQDFPGIHNIDTSFPLFYPLCYSCKSKPQKGTQQLCSIRMVCTPQYLSECALVNMYNEHTACVFGFVVCKSACPYLSLFPRYFGSAAPCHLFLMSCCSIRCHI